MITVVSELGNEYTRNITYFKKINTTENIHKHQIESNPPGNQRRTYPRRIRKTVTRY